MHLKDPWIVFTSNTLSFNEIKILHVSGTLSKMRQDETRLSKTKQDDAR